METKQREQWLDAAKTIAILIVLMNHGGLMVRGVNFWGGMFFVPVFFVLAGYTYSPKEESIGKFVARKAKRLLIPYFSVNAFLFVFFFLKKGMAGQLVQEELLTSLVGIFYARNQLLVSNNYTIWGAVDVGNIYFMPNLNSPTWFLPALFLSLVVFGVLFRLTKGDGKKIGFFTTVGVLFGVIYHYLSPVLLPFSLDATAFFLSLIVLGYFIREKQIFQSMCKRPYYFLGLLAVFIVTGIYNGSANFSVGNYGKSVMLAVFNAAAGSFILMFFCCRLKKWIPGVVALVGRHTMAIMNWHMFFFLFGITMLNILSDTFHIPENGIISGILRLCMILAAIAVITAISLAVEKWKQKGGLFFENKKRSN